jgi:predicted outer membrane repeat protein
VVRAVYLCRPRRCEDFSYATIDWALFHENQAGAGGGAIACVPYASPSFTFAHIWANRTDGNGGGVYCGDSASPYFPLSNLFNCAAAGHRGALYSEIGAAPIVGERMPVFSMDREGAYAADDASILYFHCCDIYGNQDGDWVGRIAARGSVGNNFPLDPLPCDSTDVLVDAPLYVETWSPCFRGNDPSGSCGDVGYVYAGWECGEVAKPTEWGAIKSPYR